jgi:hypothetical protein
MIVTGTVKFAVSDSGANLDSRPGMCVQRRYQPLNTLTLVNHLGDFIDTITFSTGIRNTHVSPYTTIETSSHIQAPCTPSISHAPIPIAFVSPSSYTLPLGRLNIHPSALPTPPPPFVAAPDAVPTHNPGIPKLPDMDSVLNMPILSAILNLGAVELWGGTNSLANVAKPAGVSVGKGRVWLSSS